MARAAGSRGTQAGGEVVGIIVAFGKSGRLPSSFYMPWSFGQEKLNMLYHRSSAVTFCISFALRYVGRRGEALTLFFCFFWVIKRWVWSCIFVLSECLWVLSHRELLFFWVTLYLGPERLGKKYLEWVSVCITQSVCFSYLTWWLKHWFLWRGISK